MTQWVLPRLARNEIVKMSRQKLPYLGVGAVATVCALVSKFTGDIQNGDTVNAWGYTCYAMQTGFAEVGMVFIAIFSATLLAEETNAGTVRFMLPAPAHRWEFFTAKVLTGYLYVAILATAGLAVSAVMAAWRSDFGPIQDAAGLIYGRRETLGSLGLAFFIGWFPLAAVVSFGIFISSLMKKGGQAVGVTVGLLILIESIKHVIGIDQYVFTSFVGSSWGVFNEVAQGVDYQWTPEVWEILGVSAAYCVAGFVGGLWVFTRRDMNG